MKIVIIGSGNTATVLGKKILAAGHTILQIYSHSNLPQAQSLAILLKADVIQNFDEMNAQADVYLLAVRDDALAEVVQALPNLTGIVLHTAGSVSINILKSTSACYGVLYPLQSLRKEKTNYNELPLLTDGNTSETTVVITRFAHTISNLVQPANDDYRLRLHTAAVVVSNFTNHLYTLAANFCQKEAVDFSLLKPIITETAERLYDYAPADMQTGPAIRNDGATIIKHLKLLEAYPQLHKMYDVLTKSIQENEQ